ncbi:response regulator [Pinisolibacter aquiterrae]|uniref:response regulator n=1 Tax=Pinisolibacter aquiterrae TaxID=2815579 RepID=UPI001C3D55C2|nr:response regulator [Pinisolibacter aquiterrae]MBV5262420.1 response regulator [Pinisolibacter aquiterrae]MCC8235795.1 response regulator [Pinisolibacter aquiterrae]
MLVTPASDVEFTDPLPWQVLIVEDSPIHAKLLAEAVSQFQHPTNVTIANDGLEALQLIEQGSVDVAFIDLSLPSLSGEDVVRSANKSDKMPFYAVLSASHDDATRDLMRRLHAYDYLNKPFSADDIFRILRTFHRTRITQRVLIIDDSGTARKIIRKILARSIFSVISYEAEDGISGLEEIAAQKPNIVFLDLNMPGVSGIDTFRIMKAFGVEAHVVFMSASDEAFLCLPNVDPRFKFRKPFGPQEIDAIMHIIYRMPLPFSSEPWLVDVDMQ